MDVNLDLAGNTNTRNLLLFYKQNIILLKNQNSFLLNQSNFLQHQIDQNNKVIWKILNKFKFFKNPIIICRNLKRRIHSLKYVKEMFFWFNDKSLAEIGISKNRNVKVRPQPGCTKENIEDYIEPILRKNPDAIIIHSGTNDITNDKPTKNEIKKVVKLIEDTNPNIEVIISGLIHREDREENDEIASINNQLESYCNSKNLLFVNNNNMESSCLAKDKLHLNKTGNSIFAKNIISILKKIWYSTNKHVEQVNGASFIDASTTSPEYEENINVTLKRLRHSHLHNFILSYLNNNSIWNKFDDLDKIVAGSIDILCIAEIKIDESFPNNQFVLRDYHLPYRLDITDKKGGLMVFLLNNTYHQEGLMILKFHLIYKLYLLK